MQLMIPLDRVEDGIELTVDLALGALILPRRRHHDGALLLHHRLLCLLAWRWLGLDGLCPFAHFALSEELQLELVGKVARVRAAQDRVRALHDRLCDFFLRVAVGGVPELIRQTAAVLVAAEATAGSILLSYWVC